MLACWSQIRSPRLLWEDTARTSDSRWRQKWTDQTSAWWMGCGAKHSKLLERILVARVGRPPQNSFVEGRGQTRFNLVFVGDPSLLNPSPKRQHRIGIQTNKSLPALQASFVQHSQAGCGDCEKQTIKSTKQCGRRILAVLGGVVQLPIIQGGHLYQQICMYIYI